MRTPTDLATTCCKAAAFLFLAIGAGACVTVHVDDLRFESLRRVGAEERATYPPSVRQFVNSPGYPDSEIVEATLSTERDLVRLMQRDDGWMLTVRALRCGADGVNESVRYWPELYHQRYVVGSLSGHWRDEAAAYPENSKPIGGRYFYTFYLRVRDVERPNWQSPAPAYDLSTSPFDVCVGIGAAAYMRAIEIRSNFATIPRAAFDVVVDHR